MIGLKTRMVIRTSTVLSGAHFQPQPGNFCCTSGAVAVMSGAAQVYLEYYQDDIGLIADNPGLLYANLLLWGDLTGGPSSVYDNLWGAGKLRLRAPVGGLDGPAAWSDGSTCISASSD